MCTRIIASHEFQIADDNEILKRLGMHKCRKQVIGLYFGRSLSAFHVSLLGALIASNDMIRATLPTVSVSVERYD